MKRGLNRLVLYGFDFGRPARNIWMLKELSIPFDLVNDALPFESGEMNPNDRVPYLLDRDSNLKMFESLAINVWIAQNARNLSSRPSDCNVLLPRDAFEWGHFMKWSFWAMTETDMLLFEGLMHNPKATHILSREKNYEGYFDRKKTEARANRIDRELQFPLNVLDGELEKGGGWLMGNRFTVADLNVASVLYWIHFQGKRRRDFILSKAPRVREWLDRCMRRRESPLSVLSSSSVRNWDWNVLKEGASGRSSRAGAVSFDSKL